MGAVLQGSVHVLMALKVAGGLYLLYLAIQSARSSFRPREMEVKVVGGKRWFLRGLLLNMSNPKSVIAWMAALSVSLDSGDATAAVIAPTLLCITVGFANNALYSLLFSVGGMMRGYRRWRRRIDGVVAGLFTVAGLGTYSLCVLPVNQGSRPDQPIFTL